MLCELLLIHACCELINDILRLLRFPTLREGNHLMRTVDFLDDLPPWASVQSTTRLTLSLHDRPLVLVEVDSHTPWDWNYVCRVEVSPES
jgi:hypothetical protein